MPSRWLGQKSSAEPRNLMPKAPSVTKEEIKHILDVILLVCVLLKALEPILKDLEKRA